jgi:O-antigen/teichoic acid export membrane protein
MVSVNFLVHAITLGIAPLLARLYSPAEFGRFAAAISIATVGSVLATLSLHNAIHAEPEREKAAAVVRLCTRLTFGLGALGLIGTLCAIPAGLPAVFTLVPFLMTGMAMAKIFGCWTNREGLFNIVLKTRLAAAILGSAALIAGHPLGLLGLLGSQTLGAWIGAGGLILAFHRDAPPPSRDALQAALRQHRDFARWRLPADLINSATHQAPLWIIAHFFGSTPTGQFALVHRVFAAPTAWIAGAIGEIFTREAGAAYRAKGECRAEFSTYTRLLVGLSSALIIPVLIGGPALFALVFGPAWEEAGHIARWLCGWYFLRFAVSPLSSMLVIGKRPGIDLVLQCVLVAGMGVTALLAHLAGTVASVALGLTATGLVFYGLNFFSARDIARGVSEPAPTSP